MKNLLLLLVVFGSAFLAYALAKLIDWAAKPTTIEPITSSYRNAKAGDCLKARKS